MGVLLSALSLAFIHIAGDNIAVVPAMASSIGPAIYAAVFLAYIVFGAGIAGLSAWIGGKSGHELPAVVKRLFGLRGKTLLAVAVLAVSLPASAVTGGYFAGQLLQQLTGIPYAAAVPLCLLICCLLAAGYGRELLILSNYLALLLLPASALLLFMLPVTPAVPYYQLLSAETISWPLVLSLIGYNAGGIRSVLLVETGTYFTRKNHAGIYLAVLAKFFEGIFTLLLAHIVLQSEAYGLIPLPGIAAKVFTPSLAWGFNSILLCIVLNTMVPAMLVNAKQLRILTHVNYQATLITTGFIVWAGSFVSLEWILRLMSITGLLTIVFTGWVAYALHKQAGNKSQ